MRVFCYAILLFVFVGSFKECCAETKSPTCDLSHSLIDDRTSLNLWLIFPTFAVVDASQITSSQAAHLNFTVQSVAIPMWRYLNDICGSCSVAQSRDARTLFDPLTSFSQQQSIIFAPEGAAPQVFIAEMKRQGQHLFPSLKTLLHIETERRVAEVIGFDELPEQGEGGADQYTAAIFEALTDLHFWGNNELRRQLAGEVRSGCLDGRTDRCEILKFATSLFRFRSDLAKTTNVTELRQELCRNDFANKAAR